MNSVCASDDTLYTSGQYLENTQTWHTEDSPWKAAQIHAFLKKNALSLHQVAEIGCGAGRVLSELAGQSGLESTCFKGYEISSQAMAMAADVKTDRVSFSLENLLAEQNVEYFDLLLAIDVFEHVPDYMGFVRGCKAKADYKLYHIPLDLHVSSVLRNAFFNGRYTLGHLHYFTADSAIATLKDTGHEIIDVAYTNAAFGLFRQHPSIKRAIANIPRWIFSKTLGIPFTARLLGGYSLLVLAQ